MVVSHLVQVLETKLGSARRAIRALNLLCHLSSPMPGFLDIASGDLNSCPYDYASRALTSYLPSLVSPIVTDRKPRLRSVPALPTILLFQGKETRDLGSKGPLPRELP